MVSTGITSEFNEAPGGPNESSQPAGGRVGPPPAVVVDVNAVETLTHLPLIVSIILNVCIFELLLFVFVILCDIIYTYCNTVMIDCVLDAKDVECLDDHR